jgi:4,5-dihydroxyphthalate decarboxylase
VPDHTRQWRELAGEDFWPYGIEPNRPTLEAYLQYAHEQGVAARRLTPEELFVPETRERAKI